ncbi:energy-coupling factor ABC transporter substrate-binding protein [Nodularia harveyana UHCC-0300]|uniref:Cobalt transport protein CbiN n=1 Tax=Nodularia harveyana UHCC-0300 TaxID=2974287 RepID=A0ABU5UBS4_9CYAN|nr:energy-coupling factor ABC transporter substrate-binding protein [Nodularia harveyana]MEA5580975.1 energy-coupling factor ABC transporter substrate-binding protein [Nodularia harveyana UHCC-0300]
MNQSKNGLSNWLLILAVIILAVAPLIFIRDAEFGGADGQAEEEIGAIQPGYEPWFTPIFEPPSGEVESLLFTSQAALGAGVIGYVIGLYKERHRQQRNKG